MEELPKIVQQKLVTATPGEHPDANLLSAFAENALTTKERREVLQHLAVCVDCREVVSFAQPEEEQAFAAVAMAASAGASPAPLALASAPRRFNLRWGSLAACAVIAVGLLWYSRHRPEERSVAALPPGEISSNRPSAELTVGLTAGSSAPRAKQEVARAKRRIGSRASQASPAKEFDRLAQLSNEGRAVNPASVPLAPPPPPAEASLAKNQGARDEGKALPAAAKPDSSFHELVAITPGAVLEKQDAPAQPERASKDKKAAAGGTEWSGALTATSKLDDLYALPRWTLSEGQLKRSRDGGTNWEVIPFEHEAKFRALSVMNLDLWVGGAQGVLYHSPDGGEHWIHVIPTAGAEPLTDDILRLEFSDERHGKLITAHSEWKTSNGGKSWQKKSKP